jgi:DNA modification methylase
MRLRVLRGDAREVLGRMAAESVDACVTDPPAGIAFMSKEWDNPWEYDITGHGFTDGANRVKSPAFTSARNPMCRNCHRHKRGDKHNHPCGCDQPDFDDGDRNREARDRFIRTMADIFTEVRRVLKPGGHALVWSLPRTSHWTGMALEEAGFEVRDRLAHLFGSGFPKSLDLSKAIDRAAGVQPEIVGLTDRAANRGSRQMQPGGGQSGNYADGLATKPVTADAQRWEGWGTALKPAVEDWWLVRKPLREPNVAANVLRWGTGGLNIAASRVAGAAPQTTQGRSSRIYGQGKGLCPDGQQESQPHEAGRWPTNCLLSHAEGCRCVGTRRVRTDGHYPAKRGESGYQGGWDGQAGLVERHTDGERVEAFECVAGCAVAELDRQSGARRSAGLYPTTYSHSEGYGGGIGKVQGPLYEDTGGASRFFPTFQVEQDDFVPWRYVAKADTAERNAGCEGLPRGTNDWQRPSSGLSQGKNPITGERSGVTMGPRVNNHPTVKPLALCRWLITLITPPNGTVLDCFLGSGSVGCAAAQLGFNFIGIEQDPTYHEIAVARIRHWAGLFGQVETEEGDE